MNIHQPTLLLLGCMAASQVWAGEFSFDRPGTGFGTSTTPVGHVAWEQSLPNYSYKEEFVDGALQKTDQFTGDMLLRTGITSSLELRLGFGGPSWRKVERAGVVRHDSGLGDVSVGLKQAIDLKDDKLSMAVLAEAIIATGNDQFTNQHDIYSLSSALAYQYDDIIETSMTMRYAAQNSNWMFSAIPTISYRIAGNWSGYSELVYSKPESEAVQYALGTGVIYSFNERSQADFSIATELNADRPSYRADLGFGFLF